MRGKKERKNYIYIYTKIKNEAIEKPKLLVSMEI